MTQAMLLVHGAFHDARCWERLIPLLAERGILASAVTLYRGGRDADAAAVQAEVDRLRAEGHAVAAVGHSLGCVPLAQLDPDSLSACVFLAGPAVGPGLPPIAECTLPAYFGAITSDAEGVMHFDPAAARDVFYNACDPAVAAAAARQLRPMRTYGPVERTPPVWERTLSTYLVCANDHCVDPAYQHEIAPHMQRSQTLDSDHSPMLGQPERLADALLGALG